MEQTQDCSNCGKSIPASKAATHFGYCRRNIIKCNTCGEMYDRNFLEDHQEEFHSTSKCIHCSKMLKKKEVDDHARICLMKPKFCEYCDLNVPAKDFNLHFKQCESRTTQCKLCEKSIVNKEYAIHQVTCKGISKPIRKNNNEQFARQPTKLEFSDSLNQFWQPSNKDKLKNPKKELSKESPTKKEAKKQAVFGGGSNKKPTEIKPDFKKVSVDPKELSRQHFYDNYLNPTPGLDNFGDYDFNQSFADMNYEDERSFDYLPQQSFYGKSPFDFQTPSTFEYLNREAEQLQTQEQLIQGTLFESSKRNRVDKHYQESLPSDFFSEDIMNTSFYKDILDFQKQNAILEDLSKNKVEKNNKVTKTIKPDNPQPKMTKPTTTLKSTLKNEKKK